DAIGYPVLIKAVAGGGGKGMRKVEAAADFLAALASCQREAAASFGDDRVLLEKYVTRPRHIEVQVFGDTHGNVVHLFERDCSLQRRHQKVIEEAPAPGMDAAVRAAICQAAVDAARAVDYVGAGTIEFIADASAGLSADRIWFMEMNTRLQVEHPVTEAITGLDLVEWQLRVASGEPLPLAQDEIAMSGHAVEARLYAENPATGFLPSIGPLTHFETPDSVRVDSAVEEGGEVSPHYDPMIAKLIAHAADRASAAALLAEACGDVEVWPVKTNAGFLARALADAGFRAGEVHTGFIEQRLEALAATPEPSAKVLTSAAVAALDDDPFVVESPWSAFGGATGFRLNAAPHTGVRLYLGGAELEGDASSEAVCEVLSENDEIVVFDAGEVFVFTLDPPRTAGAAGAAGDGVIRSPMPGKVSSVAVQAGDKVAKGQTLMVLEAMKMEHALAAPFDGEVVELSVAAGDQVSEGVALAKVAAAE
ncbi:MAG: biotin/lipoyl-binding protein, partial [Caulobacteraceae bacterium]|nr:biotin/lipoyl-binding protein [Caulobacteraceae bacterium]